MRCSDQTGRPESPRALTRVVRERHVRRRAGPQLPVLLNRREEAEGQLPVDQKRHEAAGLGEGQHKHRAGASAGLHLLELLGTHHVRNPPLLWILMELGWGDCRGWWGRGGRLVDVGGGGIVVVVGD